MPLINKDGSLVLAGSLVAGETITFDPKTGIIIPRFDLAAQVALLGADSLLPHTKRKRRLYGSKNYPL